MTASCGTNKIIPKQSEDAALGLIKVRYTGPATSGFGGEIILKNKESGKTYQEQFRRGYKSYIVIPNLDPGEYEVELLTVVAGALKAPISKNQNCFNDIIIRPNEIHFLGNYLVKRIPPMPQFRIQVEEKGFPSEKEIREELSGDEPGWVDLQISSDQMLFKSLTASLILR